MTDLNDPKNAAIYLRAAGHFLSQVPDLTADQLCRALVDEDDENRPRIMLWDAIERLVQSEVGDDPYAYTEELISILAEDMLDLSNGK
jgi:hypothetical protein